jgi:UV DNA damage endonuclease
MRLGVAARLMGRGAPRQLSRGGEVSLQLAWLLEALGYLRARQIACFRLPGALLAGSGGQLERALDHAHALLGQVRAAALGAGVRLSLHLPPGLGPAAEQEASAEHWSSAAHTAGVLLSALSGADWVIVSHLGGAHSIGQPPQPALQRAARRVVQLPDWLRRRVVFEPDEDAFSLPDLLHLHERTGSAIVFDLLHHRMNNPTHLAAREALQLALGTWPADLRPKAHISTQRTEAHLVPGERGEMMRVVPPRAGQHADFINPFEVIDLLSQWPGAARFDLMVEAKAGDLAVQRLRSDLRRYAPEISDDGG